MPGQHLSGGGRNAAANPRSGDSALDRLLVLLALTGFTITEPVLTIFGLNPEIFYFYTIDTTVQVALYALIVALLPALGLWLVTAFAAQVNNRAATALYQLIVLGLGALWLIQLGKWHLGVEREWLLTGLAATGAIAFILAYRRWAMVHSILKIAAIAPLIAVGVFMTSSETATAMRHVAGSVERVDAPTNTHSIVFIMLDEFPTMALLDRQGNLDKTRFPNLGRLSEQATWYRHYTAMADLTGFSVPSILTGSVPRSLTPNMAAQPNNLFRLLAPTHHLTAFENLTNLCGLDQCSQSAPGDAIEKPAPQMKALLAKTAALWLRRVALSQYTGNAMDDFAEEMSDPLDSATDVDNNLAALFDPTRHVEYASSGPKRLAKFIRTFSAEDHTALYYIHLQMPHAPWRFYGDGQMYELPFAINTARTSNRYGGDWMRYLQEYRFLHQVQYTDLLLGVVFAELQALGIWNQSVVVVTADHGRSFKADTPPRWFTQKSADAIAYVPLFIKEPMQQHGFINDSNLMAFDLLPTLADILNIDIPWQVSGLPAGHPDISQRGDQKRFYGVKANTAFSRNPILGKLKQFSDTEHFPRYTSREIASSQTASDVLGLLNDRLGLQDFIGHSPAEFEVTDGGRAHIEQLENLHHPSPDKPPLGVVMGNLEFTPEAQSKVLIAVNGSFVTASPLVTFKGVEQRFMAMLPQNVLGTDNSIGAYLVADEQLYELDIQ